MWLPNDTLEAVKHLARVYYIDVASTQLWNKNRREGELRMLTGWCWISRDGHIERHGFKTITVAYRDAYYALVEKRTAPSVGRPRLRRVA